MYINRWCVEMQESRHLANNEHNNEGKKKFLNFE